jgi:ataxia telangiectasia mutated family protein
MKLVLRLCCDHPHHVLPQLLCLHHSGSGGVGEDTSTGRASPAPPNARALAAAAVVAAVRSLGPDQGQTLASIEILLKAYIALASAPIDSLIHQSRTHDVFLKELLPSAHGRGPGGPTASPWDQCLHDVSPRPVVLTLSLPLSPTCDYSHAPRVLKFHSRFSLTDSGISRPKIIRCHGDDGVPYRQLVKGGDDMRQDAVMQQVFENVNYTLAREEETRKRRLSIRTYKIIPTTSQTGVIEFVENTEPFGQYLSHGPNSAHSRYYPDDWPSSDCRAHLNASTDQKDRDERYREVERHFHPAFRFFFLERFPDPSRWLNSRLAYTRSVAVNSIVGYILGIGDRHTHNIMVDGTTGEVVHIDFGIVFEQGRVLQTPETVPFRLTRDIVDGMGCTGVEGSFRRSCEEVLRVLRAHAQPLMTILEVVIHDPLYKWSLSPIQARAKQACIDDQAGDGAAASAAAAAAAAASAASAAAAAAGGTKSRARGAGAGAGVGAVDETTTACATAEDGRNADAGFALEQAERTLWRIRSKLQGCEDPSGERLEVEGQVELVISLAKDPRNLAKLFGGWAPWV